MRWRTLFLVLSCALGAAQAQVRLPGLPGLPSLPNAPLANPLPAPRLAELLPANVPLQELRASLVRTLLRDNPALLEADPAGEPIVRGELIVLAPTPAQRAALLAQGFVSLREQVFDGLGLASLVLAPPPGLSTREGLDRLRAIDPALQADFQHLYTRSGDVAGAGPGAARAGATPQARRVGLIDGGIDRSHPALRRAAMRTWGCEGKDLPSRHGTAIASLLVGREGAFSGVTPQATLYAADVYCAAPQGGSVEQVVQALAWLAREQVGVINVSLVGPANRLLELAVRAAAERGHLVVAAVGNDGPSAPSLYPASYPGVVGVTGIAPSRRVLPEAAQGPQVAFAAPGSELAVAQSGGAGYAVARGTSFAAPLVAGSLADALPMPDPARAPQALAQLASKAEDLGAPGRDTVFGWGLVGERSRIAPERIERPLARSQP